jgi:NDP-sugar pyrophosphorylase family protein
MSDVTFDMADNTMTVHERKAEPWKVTLVDTGEDTLTGGRLKRVADYVKNDECFCFTYGDGLADIDITKLISFHRSHGKIATVTAVARRIELGLSLGDERIQRIRQQGLFVGVVLVERTSIHAGCVNDARDRERGEVFGATELE